jgi:hypothetical protein
MVGDQRREKIGKYGNGPEQEKRQREGDQANADPIEARPVCNAGANSEDHCVTFIECETTGHGASLDFSEKRAGADGQMN